MVDKFRIILDQIVERYGTVSVFALLKMDELTNKWSVILSAPWINEENRRDIFREVVSLLNGTLTTEEGAYIARIGLLSTDEHIVQELLQYQKDAHIQQETQMNGNIIHEAWILASNPNNNQQTRLLD